MSTDETQEVKGPTGWYVAAWVGGTVLGLLLLTFLFLGRSSTGTVQTAPGAQAAEDDLETARQLLAKDTDLATCQTALNHVNAHSGQVPARRPPVLTETRAEALRRLAGLKPDEVEEITGSSFTRLDAHHLEDCCLFRDAARSLDVRGAADKAPPGLEQAAAAFDWVVRQVRTVGAGKPGGPPALVLRRGWGSDLDRALIFLSLLEQVGSPDGRHAHLLGCLLFRPPVDKAEDFWACGVVVEGGRDVYLFDPRLGLPVPGPGGKGIATVAQARTQPEVLSQLNFGKDRRYDMTPELARAAEVHLYCSLSALSPRMRHLQDEVLPPLVEVRLATDLAADRARLKAAAGGDKEPVIPTWPEGQPGFVRRFLSPEEGGIDRPAPFPVRSLPGFALRDDDGVLALTRQQRFLFELPPWMDLPPEFREHRDFRYNTGVGMVVRRVFAQPFEKAVTDGGQPRHLLLHGRAGKAVQDLVEEREQWKQHGKRRAAAGDVGPRLREWMERALTVYANQQRAATPQEKEEAAGAVAELWKDADAAHVLLHGAIAGARTAEIIYQLGLCKQEQAERLQARLDRAARKAPPTPAEAEKVQVAWRDALGWWKEFIEQYPTALRNTGGQSAARRLRGRAQAMLGDRPGAEASWQDLSAPMTELEKVACLYRARLLTGRPEK
jgi:hypothetical protein